MDFLTKKPTLIWMKSNQVHFIIFHYISKYKTFRLISKTSPSLFIIYQIHNLSNSYSCTAPFHGSAAAAWKVSVSKAVSQPEPQSSSKTRNSPDSPWRYFVKKNWLLVCLPFDRLSLPRVLVNLLRASPVNQVLIKSCYLYINSRFFLFIPMDLYVGGKNTS